jgi:hypothetical protein
MLPRWLVWTSRTMTQALFGRWVMLCAELYWRGSVLVPVIDAGFWALDGFRYREWRLDHCRRIAAWEIGEELWRRDCTDPLAGIRRYL